MPRDMMDWRIRGYLLMTAIATVIAIAISMLTWGMWDDDGAKELMCLGAIAAGMICGLLVLLMIRRRDALKMDQNRCQKIRDSAAIISFFSIVPTMLSAVIAMAFPDYTDNEFVLVSALMVVISMIIQAFFWKLATDVGYMSFITNIFLVISLILLNVSSILYMDHGGAIMLVLSMLPALAAIILMFDWEWSADIGFVLIAVSAVAAMIVTFMDDAFQIGMFIVILLPLVFIILNRTRLKATFLIYDGQKLN